MLLNLKSNSMYICKEYYYYFSIVEPIVMHTMYFYTDEW